MLLLAACTSLLTWAVLSPTEARADTDSVDLAGSDPYQASVLVSRAGFAPGVPGLVVASGDDYMAATCSAVLAAAYEGPVLLTPGGSLDQRVRDEIWRLGPDRIFVVGTQASVASDIAQAFPRLADSGRIVMLRGADGQGTAALVAEQVKLKAGAVKGVVLMGDDAGSAPAGCAVATSVLAAAEGWPLLFVPASGALTGSMTGIVPDLAPATVLEVQTSVDPGLPAQVVKIEGKNRYDLAAKIAEYASSAGLSYAHTAVVGGSDDVASLGMAVGAYLARNQGIAVLCDTRTIPAETLRLLTEVDGAANRVDFCGPFDTVHKRVQLVLSTAGLPLGFGAYTLQLKSGGAEVQWVEERLTGLSYRPGPVDGVFDKRTMQGVIGFEKWEGMKRDGIVRGEVWWRLLSATRPVPRHPQQGKWLEVDKSKQVLLYCVDRVVQRTIAVSTGTYSVGFETPSGVFRIWKENTYERKPRYHPLYFKQPTWMAIHGYKFVPSYRASHGCIRMIFADMDDLHYLIPIGTAVYIY